MSTPAAPPVLVTDVGPVRTVTLNRPAVRNAIDIPLRIALAEVIEAADVDPSVRAMVITGAGPAFCSGGDISTMARMPVDKAFERIDMVQRVIRAIWHTRKPVLAAVEGSAFGAGAALAIACDRVVAARDARFATTFTRVGLAGDMGVFVSLPARVGVARARQMLLLPDPVDAPAALTIGLVDSVVHPGDALTSALADARRLADGPAEALGVIKTMLAGPGAAGPLAALDRETRCQAGLFDTDDFAEGIAAFRQKRTPVFGSREGARS
ncbi:MAG TPA: enoyl-CoA hydratase-related protein [Mycobacterium sp.]